MIEMGRPLHFLRFKTVLFAMAISIAACSPESGSADEGDGQIEPPQIETVPAINPNESNREFAERLAKSPTYRSAIRADLIRRADEYRQSYRPAIDRYRGLEPEFRCPYPVGAIERAQTDGWELTRCDIFGATFLKPLEKPRHCKGLPTIPDHYATLRLQFGSDWLRKDSKVRREKAALIFFQEILAPLTELPESVARRFSIGSAADKLEYGMRDFAGITAFYFLDREADALVVLHEPDTPAGCSRNAFGMILGDGTRAMIDMPSQDYARMREELAKVIQYTGEV